MSNEKIQQAQPPGGQWALINPGGRKRHRTSYILKNYRKLKGDTNVELFGCVLRIIEVVIKRLDAIRTESRSGNSG